MTLWVPFVSVLLGSLTTSLGSYYGSRSIESYKFKNRRRALASALVGDVRVRLASFSSQAKDSLRDFAKYANSYPAMPELPLPELKIYESTLQEIGFFPSDLPEKIVVFYGFFKGFLFLRDQIMRGVIRQNGGSLVSVADQLISSWETETEPLGKELVCRLSELAGSLRSD